MLLAAEEREAASKVLAGMAALVAVEAEAVSAVPVLPEAMVASEVAEEVREVVGATSAVRLARVDLEQGMVATPTPSVPPAQEAQASGERFLFSRAACCSLEEPPRPAMA